MNNFQSCCFHSIYFKAFYKLLESRFCLVVMVRHNLCCAAEKVLSWFFINFIWLRTLHCSVNMFYKTYTKYVFKIFYIDWSHVASFMPSWLICFILCSQFSCVYQFALHVDHNTLAVSFFFFSCIRGLIAAYQMDLNDQICCIM